MAWGPLGWKVVAFAEIDPFCCALLGYRFPGVPNLGDFTKIKGLAKPIDVLVGGTPCQSFSVAGRRAGLDDPRGVLAFEFLRLTGRLRPRWVVWENVPGVHSSWSDEAAFAPSEESRRIIEEARRAGESLGLDLGSMFGAGAFEEVDQSNDFDSFLVALEELGYGVATRVLDAQHFGVPQRRRRVFVVGCLGNWSGPAAVLFERDCLRGHPAPREVAGSDVACCLAASTGGERNNHENNYVAGTLGGGSGTRGWCNDLDRAGAFVSGQITHSLRADGNVAHQAGVRRLTPRETERLQGFPDDWTLFPVKLIRKPTGRVLAKWAALDRLGWVDGQPWILSADGPRYRAIGNSMAVPVMRWIGERIQMVNRLKEDTPMMAGMF